MMTKFVFIYSQVIYKLNYIYHLHLLTAVRVSYDLANISLIVPISVLRTNIGLIVYQYYLLMAGGTGSGSSALCPGLIWAIFWFIGLLVIAWPVAFLLAWLYVLLEPFGACISPLAEMCDGLLRLVQLPLTFARNMMAMKSCC